MTACVCATALPYGWEEAYTEHGVKYFIEYVLGALFLVGLFTAGRHCQVGFFVMLSSVDTMATFICYRPSLDV